MNGLDYLKAMTQVQKLPTPLSSCLEKNVPNDKNITCATIVCDCMPPKDEKFRVRITTGGDRLHYHLDSGSPSTNLLETKLILNRILSDSRKGARFISLDVKDHFLVIPMTDPEHMIVKHKHVPDEIKVRHNIDQLVTNDEQLHIKIQKGMPGIRQDALLVYKHLRNFLQHYGYVPVQVTPGMWKHVNRPTKKFLCADDFGVK